jgi:hypothetical protein
MFGWIFAALLCGAPGAHAQQAPPAARTPGKEDLREAVERLTRLVEQQRQELAAQRAALEEQQRRMAALERSLRTTAAAGRGSLTVRPAAATLPDVVPATASPANETGVPNGEQGELSARVAKLETAVADQQKKSESKWKNIGNFSFSGDARIRYEPFFGGGATSSPPPDSRHRGRFRVRFNVAARLSNEWNAGFTLASGDDLDPISTNQTFTSFFERKPVNIDKAFIEYKPQWARSLLGGAGELTLTAGKFAAPWYRTEMTLDNDLNPEGVSEVLTFGVKTAVLKRLTFVGFQLPFNEVSAGPDSFLHGGQFQSHWQFGSRVKFAAYAAFFDWNRTDAIRAAQSSGTLTGSSNRNAATATQFGSKFGILDLIARWDVKTASPRWPLMLQFNFASNTRACSNLVNISGTPPACNPRDRHAHWMEVQLGQTQEVGDFNFGYTFLRIEREAVLGAFNFSDLRAPSNLLTHRLNFGYQTHKNITLSFTGLFGRQLTTSTSAEERILKRLQLDLIYKF